jgi:hypothetical protein
MSVVKSAAASRVWLPRLRIITRATLEIAEYSPTETLQRDPSSSNL